MLASVSCLGAAVENEEEELARHEHCIVGLGPAGIQMSYSFALKGQDFVAFEAKSHAGSQFVKYPVHRKLISINKRHTGLSNELFNERHDWNSILSVNESLKFTRYSKEYYPHADDYVRYMRDYGDVVNEMAPGRLHYDSKVSRVSRGENDGFLLTVATGKKESGEEIGEARYFCGRLIWATGMQETSMSHVDGYDMEGVEMYSEVDATNERYENETIAVVGGGNAGLETAAALQNSAARVTLFYPPGRSPKLQIAWRTHYVGHARSINLAFIDGYLLKSLDTILQGEGGYVSSIAVAPGSSKPNPATGRMRIAIGPFIAMDKDATQRMDKWDRDDPRPDQSLEKELNLTTVKELMDRIKDEGNRGSRLGFDRIIFCTGFSFGYGKGNASKSTFDDDVRPAMGVGNKFPDMNPDYESTNVRNMYFAGALQHGRDYRRSAGGFIHGFRYTARTLHRLLTGYPSIPLTAEELIKADHMMMRINFSPGPYQMYGELCDLIVLEQSSGDGAKEAGVPFARYYEDFPLAHMPKFVLEQGHHRFISVCFEYGHGKFSSLSPLNPQYIGTRQGTIEGALGLQMAQMMGPPAEGEGMGGGMGGGDGGGGGGMSQRKLRKHDMPKPPPKRMGSTGAGVDSNFLHPIISYYNLHDKQTHRMLTDRLDEKKLKKMAKVSHIVYPLASHHLIEDLETTWDLFYTHMLPCAGGWKTVRRIAMQK